MTCSYCQKDRTLDEFYANRRECKRCVREKQAARYWRAPDYYRQRKLAYYYEQRDQRQAAS